MVIQIPNQKAVIEHYGLDAQIPVYMEECAELAQAISKMHRKPSEARRDNLVEEMADVLVCMNQLQRIYGIQNWELQKKVREKTQRTEERINGDV